MVAVRLVWGILLIVGKFNLHNVSQVRVLMHFMLELRTFKPEFPCFDTIIAMICVCYNNHFSCVIPPCFVSNNVTVLEHNATKGRWFLVVGSMMLFVVELASAKYL
jgi:hypothetical protein